MNDSILRLTLSIVGIAVAVACSTGTPPADDPSQKQDDASGAAGASSDDDDTGDAGAAGETDEPADTDAEPTDDQPAEEEPAAE